MNHSKILAVLKHYKKENAKKYGINSIGIFGSYSTGQATEKSDIDVIIKTTYPDLYTLVHIKEELEKLFKKPVDLVRNRKNMNPYLKKRIERDARYVMYDNRDREKSFFSQMKMCKPGTTTR